MVYLTSINHYNNIKQIRNTELYYNPNKPYKINSHKQENNNNNSTNTVKKEHEIKW